MDAIKSLSDSLYAACLRDLPAIEYKNRDWAKWNEFKKGLTKESLRELTERERTSGVPEGPTVWVSRRPDSTECSVRLFPQMWPSTGLGYPGLAGQAFTEAYTAVITCQRTRSSAVYFGEGGRLAYLVPVTQQTSEWKKALDAGHMPSIAVAKELGWLAPPDQTGPEAA